MFSLSRRADRPVVSVSDTATAGGRCPACGQPLFPWVESAGTTPIGDERYVFDRCENCGLALLRGDAGEGVARLIESTVRRASEQGGTEIVAPNARSLQAGIGVERWTGLQIPSRPWALTPQALELLLEQDRGRIGTVGFVAAAGMAAMWQTIVNLLTFNRDFAPRALRGDLRPGQSRRGGLGFAIDTAVTVLIAIPVAALAVVLELGAILVGRGGVMRARVSPLSPPD